jgi:hypothetical protein
MDEPIFDGASGETFNDPVAFITRMMEKLQADDIDAADVIDTLANLLGYADNHTHDIVFPVKVALIALGHRDVADMVGHAKIQTMPWGLSFNLGVTAEFNDLRPDQQHAFLTVMAAVLTSGGQDAVVVNNKLRFADDNIDDVDLDTLLGNFRAQIDEELGPDADIEWRRWGL